MSFSSTHVGRLLIRSWPRLVGGILLTLLYSAAVFLTPLASERLIDEVLGATDLVSIRQGILFFLVICVSQPILSFLKDLAFLNVTERLVLELRERLFAKMLSLPFRSMEDGGSGEFVSRITNDIRGASSFLTEVVAAVLKDIILIVLISAGMLIQSLAISLMVIGAFALFYLLSLLISRRLEVLSHESLENFDRLCTAAADTWRNIALIKTSHIEKRVASDFGDVVGRTRAINMSMGRLSSLMGSLSGLVTVLSLALIYALGAVAVLEGRMTLGSVVALGLYFQLLSSPTQELNNALVQYKEARPSLRRIEEFLSQSEDSATSLSRSSSASHGPIGNVMLNGVCFRYTEEDEASHHSGAIQNFSCSMKKPGLYVLCGRSGAGKSTLLKILAALYPPSQGRILVDGQRIAPAELRRLCSYVSQEPEMLSGHTLRFNLMLEDEPNSSREGAMHGLVKSLALDGVIDSLPKGYDTVITERAAFSGGELKRLGLIRALMGRRPILLLDEIMAGLDDLSKRRVEKILLQCAEKRLIIVATHDDHLAGCADAVYQLGLSKLESSF